LTYELFFFYYQQKKEKKMLTILKQSFKYRFTKLRTFDANTKKI